MKRLTTFLPAVPALLFVALLATAADADDRTLIEWRFATQADAKGWSPGSIADCRVEDGMLTGTPTGNDPLLIGPVFDPIAATAVQWVEIRMRSAAGHAELYWTETLEGRFGGFSGRKMTLFDCAGGEAVETYRIRPFWQAAGKIIRLRIDPPSAGPFAIESIRIVSAGDTAEASTAKQWQFQNGAAPWAPSRIDATANMPPLLESPLLAVPTEPYPFVHVRMAADRGEKAILVYATEKSTGWQRVEFPIEADGQMHSYNVDLGQRPDWVGNVLLLGLRASNVPEARHARYDRTGRRPGRPAGRAVALFRPRGRRQPGRATCGHCRAVGESRRCACHGTFRRARRAWLADRRHGQAGDRVDWLRGRSTFVGWFPAKGKANFRSA